MPENPEVDELIYFIPEKYVVVQKLSRSAYRIKGKATGTRFVAKLNSLNMILAQTKLIEAQLDTYKQEI